MKKIIIVITLVILLVCPSASAQKRDIQQNIPTTTVTDTMPRQNTAADSLASDTATAKTTISDEELSEDELMDVVETKGLHKELKRKFIEGNAGFMSLVALALVLGLAFCIERIIYLTLSEINAKKFMADIDAHIERGDIEGAKNICRETRGPVASICYQGLLRISESLDDIERSIISFGTVQTANLERGCTWITLFIQIAPSLGFLGTVIGMVMSFDQIQQVGDISATIVASGMKVALITTIFGIIVALVLQLFYNYIVSKIEHITSQMEESAITLLDCITKYKGVQGVQGVQGVKGVKPNAI